MRRARYLAVIGPAPTDGASLLASLRPAMPGAEVAIEREGLVLVAEPGRTAQLGDGTIVAGSLFERSGPRAGLPGRAISFDRLIEKCWGDYVAFAPDHAPDGARLLRAPMGGLPCYWTRHRQMTIVASDLEALAAAGVPRPRADPAALARHLAAADIRTPETCLAGIGEIQGGEQVLVTGSAVERTIRWSPWAFAEGGYAWNPDEAARRVRDAATGAVTSLAGQSRSIVLKLSGGVDSSIVAACLTRSGTPFTALNLVTHDPAGDERDYARLVTHHCGAPLVERFRDPSRVDLERSLAVRLPRPTVRNFLQETARIAAEAATEAHADAIFDGGGGDNVFCSLLSARPAADCLLAGAGIGMFLKVARDIAELAPASLPAVAWRALAIAARASPVFHWPLDLRFLSDEASAEAAKAATHSWLDPPRGALPGKAAHIAMIVAAQSVAEGFDAEDSLPTFSPLISQPVVEACLQAPSWLWFDEGRNRALARRAFASMLPTAVINRRSKGAPDSFIAELFERNRSKIRDMLLGGSLRRAGLLDADGLSDALGSEGPVRGHDFLRIMKLVDAEAWARSWSLTA